MEGKGADSNQEDKTSRPYTCDVGNKNSELKYSLTYCTDGFGFMKFLFVLFCLFKLGMFSGNSTGILETLVLFSIFSISQCLDVVLANAIYELQVLLHFLKI